MKAAVLDVAADGREVLATELARRLAFPEGWSVRPLQRLKVDAIGVCHASRVHVTGRGIAEDWVLSAPDCGVEDGVRDE